MESQSGQPLCNSGQAGHGHEEGLPAGFEKKKKKKKKKKNRPVWHERLN